jgi:hypothetical protein
MATRTITTELNSHQQYEMTETITVPPAAHQEIVTSDNNSMGVKLLSNFGIKMLPEESSSPAMRLNYGQTLSLTEAGKRILSDTSPIKKLVATPKYQTVQIKQEGSSTPKIIQLNGGLKTSATSPATRIIRLSSSQLSTLKLGNSSC